jgi:hypothetical protein
MEHSESGGDYESFIFLKIYGSFFDHGFKAKPAPPQCS